MKSLIFVRDNGNGSYDVTDINDPIGVAYIRSDCVNDVRVKHEDKFDFYEKSNTVNTDFFSPCSTCKHRDIVLGELPCEMCVHLT
jgi:hypothetical protein